MSSCLARPAPFVAIGTVTFAQAPSVDAIRDYGPGSCSGAAFAVDPGTGMAVLHGGRGPWSRVRFGTSLGDGLQSTHPTASCGLPGTMPSPVEQQLLVDGLRPRLLLVGGTPLPA